MFTRQAKQKSHTTFGIVKSKFKSQIAKVMFCHQHLREARQSFKQQNNQYREKEKCTSKKQRTKVSGDATQTQMSYILKCFAGINSLTF